MSETAFSYVPIRYVHDSLTGESLNVGVVVYAPSVGFLRAKLSKNRSKRLSDAFRNFDSKLHGYVLKDLESGLLFLGGREGLGMQGSLFNSRPESAEQVLRKLWPDRGSRYSFGEASFGTSEDLTETLTSLYERLVISQMPEILADDRAKDEKVWKKVEKPLREKVPTSKLTEYKFAADFGEVELKHTYSNGGLSIFQPLSFDLADAASITRKASTWFGYASGFASTENVANVVYLMGRPRSEAKLEAFIRAKKWLQQASKLKVFTDDEVDPFVRMVETIVGSR